MNRVDAAWVAGLIEGEGYIRVQPRLGTPQTIITVSSTDEDVCRKLHKVTALGSVMGPYRSKHEGKIIERWKPFWVWQVASKPQILALAAAIREHLCSRRRRSLDAVMEVAERADEYAAARKAARKAYWSHRTHCKHGHPYDTLNARIYTDKEGVTHMFCRLCQKERKKRWADKKARVA